MPMTAVERKRLGLSSTLTTELDKRRMEKSAEEAVTPGTGNANVIVTENIQIIPPVKPVAPMTNFEKKRLEAKAPKVETDDEPVIEYKAPASVPESVKQETMESVAVAAVETPVPDIVKAEVEAVAAVEPPVPEAVMAQEEAVSKTNPEVNVKKQSVKQRLQELEDAKEYLSMEEYSQIRREILQQL